MTNGARSARVATACVAAALLAGCGLSSGGEQYEEMLTSAGFDDVHVIEEEVGLAKRKSVVAYDFSWRVSTDGDDATCTVELEHLANRDGSLRGSGWYIEEVNGEEIEGWGDGSPDAATVRRLLQEHGFDC